MTALVDAGSLPMSAEMLWTYQLLCVCSISALTVTLHDWLLTLADEWKYVWRHPKAHPWIKALFLVLRYVSLGTQLFLLASNSRFMSMYPVSLLICRKYHIFTILLLLIQLSSIDFLMILRVWLVLNRGRRSLLVLIVAFIGQLSIVIVLVFHLSPGLRMDNLCTSEVPLSSSILFWLAGFFVHTISWLFTMYQCHRARRQGLGRTPLIWLLERDGTCVWLLFGVTLAVGWVVGDRISTSLTPGINDSWIQSWISVLGCRMFINLQRLAYQETEDIELYSTVMFTTIIPPFEVAAGEIS